MLGAETSTAGAFTYNIDVSETRDKRRRGDLDLFVLALIDSGLTTPYELQQAAGLSPGATIPALRRLVAAKLVVQGKPGSRGRTEHKITAAGQRYLKGGWKKLIADVPSGDLDADLRVALLALWVGGDRRQSADFLHQSAARISEAVSAAESVADSKSLPPLAYWYRKMRSASAMALAHGQSKAAMEFAKALPQTATIKRGSIK